ncbi:hypothetical protein [Streptomyces sp. NPDC059788]|uniref:hypothetical protein n=1 Tax=Streptomyces sp. NPDC059788 TaxID=3346948 RepID=UPI0036536C74
MGTLYVVVSNTHLSDVTWRHIDVLVPHGTDSGDLTNDIKAIKATVAKPYTPDPGQESPNFTYFKDNRFRAAAPSRGQMTLPAQESFVLKLENIPVSDKAGLVLIAINELAWGGDLGKPPAPWPSVTNLALVKQTPQIPQNFRADRSLVGAGQGVVLRWDGPNHLDYWIGYPDGSSEPVSPPAQSPPAPYGPHQHIPTRPLSRGTTYTLIAGKTGSNGTVWPGYYLTTTVHAVIPEFESGARAPWVEGTRDRGRITFRGDGVSVDDRNGVPGTVTGGTADVNDVKAAKVKGRSPGSGWVDFPDTGITVHHGPDRDLGTVNATGVNTTWVGDRDGGKGWIGFPQAGVDIRKDGGQAWGALSADKADLNEVTAQWVEGRNGTKSRLAFTDTGVKITDPEGHRGTIVAGETNVRSVVTPWVSGPMPGAGWITFREEGVDVMRDSAVTFGTIRADSFEGKHEGTGRPLHRRLPPYEWPPKTSDSKQTPAKSRDLAVDPE